MALNFLCFHLKCYSERFSYFQVRRGKGSESLDENLPRLIPCAGPLSSNPEVATGAKVENHGIYICVLKREPGKTNLIFEYKEGSVSTAGSWPGAVTVLSLAGLKSFKFRY